jgi:hypothetical protein
LPDNAFRSGVGSLSTSVAVTGTVTAFAPKALMFAQVNALPASVFSALPLSPPLRVDEELVDFADGRGG